MIDVVAALKERRLKAEAKVARAEKALESARRELADVAAAERVIAEITGESMPASTNENSASERDIAMARLLPADPFAAISPSDLHQVYVEASGDSINLDAFRTALWRLLKKTIKGDEKSWAIKAENGKYWREAVPTFSETGEAVDDDDGIPLA